MADRPTCLIDDFGPLPIESPLAVSDLGDLVQHAFAEHRALYPAGGQTMMHRGLPPSRPGRVVDLRHLSRVIDYPTGDMTITVQAGITWEKLQTILAKENQRLPIDIPWPADATLGGIL
ncbi:MAG TPA: FAD-binding protein, partial [Gemmataceae bacterium]|nr:FAD-binding protein [Gemmataceae bacterium]